MSAPPEQQESRHAQYARRRRARLAEYLKLSDPDNPDSPKVSTHPDCPHGHRDGYDLYGCRCPECSEHSAGPRIQEYREQRYQAAAVAVLRGQGVPEGEPADTLAAELIELWRRSRGASRHRKLAARISKAPHGLTGSHALFVTDELITALSAAGANRAPGDLTP